MPTGIYRPVSVALRTSDKIAQMTASSPLQTLDRVATDLIKQYNWARLGLQREHPLHARGQMWRHAEAKVLDKIKWNEGTLAGTFLFAIGRTAKNEKGLSNPSSEISCRHFRPDQVPPLQRPRAGVVPALLSALSSLEAVTPTAGAMCSTFKSSRDRSGSAADRNATTTEASNCIWLNCRSSGCSRRSRSNGSKSQVAGKRTLKAPDLFRSSRMPYGRLGIAFAKRVRIATCSGSQFSPAASWKNRAN